ncbi:MAG: hypothetical protein PHV99_03045 [Candidatus Pacebacteria bacterium]|nr:hypothetical protein [Candidatus Paceibacterota bacterium]
MAKNDMEGECMMCDRHHMQDGMCRQHHWMHIVIKIFVALFIFWCGVQFGELKSAIRSALWSGDYGYGMMNSYGIERSQGYYGVPSGMMGTRYYYGTTSAVPATTTKTTVKK